MQEALVILADRFVHESAVHWTAQFTQVKYVCYTIQCLKVQETLDPALTRPGRFDRRLDSMSYIIQWRMSDMTLV